jgi:hypothetical protein
MHSHHQHREALSLARRSSRLHPPGTFEHWPSARLSHSDSLAENAVVATASAMIDEASFGGGGIIPSMSASSIISRSRMRRPVPAAGMARPVARSSPAAALPAWIPPQLTQLVDAAPEGDQWLHEIKFDGYRMHARLDRGAVKLLTRTGLDWTHKSTFIRFGFERVPKVLPKMSPRLSIPICAPGRPGISKVGTFAAALS